MLRTPGQAIMLGEKSKTEAAACLFSLRQQTVEKTLLRGLWGEARGVGNRRFAGGRNPSSV